MKKLKRIFFVTVFVAIAGYGIYSNQKVNPLSDLALTNVEALASDESSVKDGAANIIFTDLGKRTDCIDGMFYVINKYHVECIGKGTLPCQSGTYERYAENGPCYEA